MSKDTLRKELISKRIDFYSSKEYPKASELVSDNIVNFLNKIPEIRKKTLGCYYSTRGEVDIKKIFNQFSLAFPRIIVIKDHSEIEYAKISSTDQLENSSFGLKSAPKNLEICYPEVLLIPGIIFDKKYHRIGYGKGHFDKFLLKTKKLDYDPLKIGVCFEFQLIDEIPHEKHDQKMDIIITENRVYTNAFKPF